VRVKLQGKRAEEVVPKLQKVLGPFADVAHVEATNELLVLGTGGQVREMLKVLRDMPFSP
jgi:hypothetical protein